MRSSYTPVSELTVENRIDWQLDMGPYTDTTKIGLHLPRMTHRLASIGIRQLTITGYEGEQPQFETTITGLNTVDASGQATATGVAKQAAVQRQESFFQPGNSALPDRLQWKNATLKINKSAAASEISDKIRQGASREKGWANVINHSLKDGLQSMAMKRSRALKDNWLVNMYGTFGVPVGNALLQAEHQIGGFLNVMGMLSATCGVVSEAAELSHAKRQQALREVWPGGLMIVGVGVAAVALALPHTAPLIKAWER